MGPIGRDSTERRRDGDHGVARRGRGSVGRSPSSRSRSCSRSRSTKSTLRRVGPRGPSGPGGHVHWRPRGSLSFSGTAPRAPWGPIPTCTGCSGCSRASTSTSMPTGSGLLCRLHAPPRRPFKLRIFMFGGSTLSGSGARDAFTIPSILAPRLEAEGVAATVVNRAEGRVRLARRRSSELPRRRKKGPRAESGLFLTTGAYAVCPPPSSSKLLSAPPHNEFNRVVEIGLARPSHFWRRGLQKKKNIRPGFPR